MSNFATHELLAVLWLILAVVAYRDVKHWLWTSALAFVVGGIHLNLAVLAIFFS